MALSLVMFMLIALVPCVIGAISGIGGGIIIKPALDMAAGSSLAGNFAGSLGAVEINFLSGCTVLAMSAVSLLRSRKTGVRLEAGRGAALAVGAAAGGISGKIFFSFVVMAAHKNTVGAIQSLLLIIMTGGVMLYMRKKESIARKNLRFLPFCTALGLGLGLISAFLGIGGGPINIMAISFFLYMDTKTSALHSLFVIFLSQLASFFLTLGTGIPAVPLPGLGAMICGGVSGALIGSYFVRLLRNDQIEKLFNILMIAVIALSACNLINFIRSPVV
ncbi:UPF0721 transmembrane protein [Spirochaetia bacterium]|nr:UPF0721 transmembrane protein [Spirochaetia bacterium]